MMRFYILIVTAGFTCTLATVPDRSLAYDVPTHRTLGQKAAEAAVVIGAVLTDDLKLPSGANTTILDNVRKTVVDWIGEGAALEDAPDTRVLNHFHDPLRPFDAAGLKVATQLGQSSV